MENVIPRAAAIHDLSGFGRCALTVVIPVLSTMGIQVCPIPTAVLSTQTVGFENYYFLDLSSGMEAYARHWQSISLSLDCIYTGYLGSPQQVDKVLNIIDMFGHDKKLLLVIDPVMGDDGSLYSTFTKEMPHKMKDLIRIGSIITPNLTEACLLLDEIYTDEPLPINKIKHYLKALSDIGPDHVVITSVKTIDGVSCNAGYNKLTDTYFLVPYIPIPESYPGTGDIFTSVLTGAILKKDPFITSVIKASGFVGKAAAETYKYKTAIREGVLLEKVLPELYNPFDITNYQII